jgi:hypothetical protein
VGFTDEIIPLNSLDHQGELTIHLKNKIYSDTTATVYSNNLLRYQNIHNRITVSPTNLKSAPIKSNNDVLANLKHLSDVTSSESEYFALSFNSGGRQNNLFLLDGMRIYQTDHYFGYYSIFDVDAIKSINIYPMNFSSKYGGVLSGVVELFSKDGNTEKPTFSASLNALNANITYGEKITDDLSIFIQSRRSIYDIYKSEEFTNLELRNASIANKGIDKFREKYYSDNFSKLSYQINNKNLLRFSIFKSLDKNKYGYEITDSLGIHKINEEQSWENFAFNLSWFSQIKEKSSLDLSISSSSFSSTVDSYEDYNVDSVLSIVRRTGKFPNFFFNGFRSSSIFDWDLNLHFSSIVSPDFHLNIGANINYFTTDDRQTRDLKNYTFYTQNLIKLYSDHTLNIGFRSSYISSLKKNLTVPRLSYEFQSNEHFSFLMSYSKHNEIITPYFLPKDFTSHIDAEWNPINPELKIPEATHYSAQFVYNISNEEELKLKLFRKDINNEHKGLVVRLSETDSLGAAYEDHKNSGFSLIYHKNYKNGINLFTSYSYIEEKSNTYKKSSQISFVNHTYHSLKTLVTYMNNNWAFSLDGIFNFGERDDHNWPNAKYRQFKRKSLLRFNLGAKRTFNFENTKFELGLSLNNALTNIFSLPLDRYYSKPKASVLFSGKISF